ncbi:SpoIIE family protein phosphatase [candidate division KSB3 bacterium]|uniref:SpoIIE family protein phosphatase n=1 Tax=candidate division KSB3 bacterium TaxID=2044937 RepID=A0A9D5JVZ0_9BACT|nr:SpoIIE family protein phosphatase [candidate division KSB3 bacterium]MBD3325143.1 SpoIIE family protein phosphatase [candidate division KSB3 bacterium]
MSRRGIRWIKNLSLKAKLCVLTVVLVGAVMLFVGYVVIDQQRESLMLQMKETGSFLVKNLAKNVIEPLLVGDTLSLNNLITSLEARDRIHGNPARFTRQEYEAFLHHFLLEDKIDLLSPFITEKGNNVYIQVENIPMGDLKRLGAEVFRDVLTIVNKLETQQQYEAFFTQYPWTRSVVESLTTLNDLEVVIRQEDIPESHQEDLTTKLAQRLLSELLGHVKNPFISYAIVVDKDGVIQAHPDLEQFVGKDYVWPRGTAPLEPGEELKVQPAMFKGESVFDFATPVMVRDKNIGTVRIGTVHIGLREEYILESIRAAKYTMLSIALVALLLGSAGAYLLAALIVKPIKSLVRDAEILGGGDLDHHIHVLTHDEVGMLAHTLDTTRVKLKDAQSKLVANERVARELEIAREIQMNLLPKDTPILDHVEIGTLYRAAAQVGGDLYDFFWVSQHELGVVIADVSGKGIPGSLVMTMVKAIIRAKAVKSDAPDHTLPAKLGGDPASVVRKVNQMISHDIKKGMFITATYGILNVDTLRFQFVSAGHNDTLVYNARTGSLREYNPKGIALGLDKGDIFDMMLQDQEILLASGDLLLQYTDGITEAMNGRHEEFGEERLKAAIQKYAHQPVDDFLTSLDQEIRAFAEGFAQSDDITAIAVKVK